MMKEKYEKPQVMLLNFGNEKLSAGCKYESTSQMYDCPIDIGIGKVFSYEKVCELTAVEETGKVCYQVSIDESKIFGS